MQKRYMLFRLLFVTCQIPATAKAVAFGPQVGGLHC
jgi:hypothetical protein